MLGGEQGQRGSSTAAQPRSEQRERLRAPCHRLSWGLDCILNSMGSAISHPGKVPGRGSSITTTLSTHQPPGRGGKTLNPLPAPFFSEGSSPILSPFWRWGGGEEEQERRRRQPKPRWSECVVMATGRGRQQAGPSPAASAAPQ